MILSDGGVSFFQRVGGCAENDKPPTTKLSVLRTQPTNPRSNWKPGCVWRSEREPNPRDKLYLMVRAGAGGGGGLRWWFKPCAATKASRHVSFFNRAAETHLSKSLSLSILVFCASNHPFFFIPTKRLRERILICALKNINHPLVGAIFMRIRLLQRSGI